MKSLLWKYIDDEYVVKPESVLEDTLFTDLKIIKLLESVFDNYSDVDEIVTTMKKVPDIESLKLRQGIFTDVLNDNDSKLDSLYYDLVDLVGRYVSLKEAIEITKKKVFLVMYYHHYYLYLEKVVKVLTDLNVTSTGLKELVDTINQKLKKDETIEIRKTVEEFYKYIMSHFSFNTS